ncbi:MAG: hypothetical protein ACT4UQ_01685 [Gammaproteobacteria bacterium]
MKSRVFLTAVAAGFVCAQALAAPPPAAPGDPWAKVPALPTACYSGQDKWQDQSTAAFNVVQEAHNRQNDINDGIRQNASDTFGNDPMAVAQRLQQEMMNDPQNAQKMMEQLIQRNEQAPAEAAAKGEREQQIEAAGKSVQRQYEAALAKAYGPGNARLDALMKKHKPMAGIGDLWLRYGESGEPAWVRPEAHAIMKEWDKAYVATCATWWSATGPIHAYMKRYKDYLVQERIPFGKEGDKAKLEHYRQVGVATTAWRTTTDYEAVEDYLKMAQELFGQRETAPYCGPEGRGRCQ